MSRRALFQDLFGDFSDSDVNQPDLGPGPSDPHPVSESEMEVALNDEADWEDVLPASSEGPQASSAKTPDGG